MSRWDSDWLLVVTLDAIADSGHPRELTVFTGGLAISGTAVPEEVYFEKIGLEHIAETMPEERVDIKRVENEIREQLEQDDLSDDERDDLWLRLHELERTFITMIDVTVFGAGAGPMQADVWRGRLSQISGWSLGAASLVE